MNHQSNLTDEEIAIINRVSGKFLKRMQWNHHWDSEDMRQDLIVFWLTKKQSGWKKPVEWQGAMGRCLILHLIDLQKKECADKRQSLGNMTSLNQLMEKGFDIPDESEQASSFSDFLNMLASREKTICNLFLRGQNKSQVASSIKRSRPYLNQRLKYVRHLAEQYL